MEKKGKFVKLSRPFWSSYKLFLKGECSLAELQNSFETAKDILFFKEEYGKKCDLFQSFKQLELKKLNSLIDTLLDEMKDMDNEARRANFKKILRIFLQNYACFAKEGTKKKSNDIILNFSLPIGEDYPNEKLDEKVLDLMSFLMASRWVKDKETFMKPIVFKLICLYSALAVSDKDGVIKCKELGKGLSEKWDRSTPEIVTLSVLRKREKDSKLPINECELLQKYSF